MKLLVVLGNGEVKWLAILMNIINNLIYKDYKECWSKHFLILKVRYFI